MMTNDQDGNATMTIIADNHVPIAVLHWSSDTMPKRYDVGIVGASSMWRTPEGIIRKQV